MLFWGNPAKHCLYLSACQWFLKLCFKNNGMRAYNLHKCVEKADFLSTNCNRFIVEGPPLVVLVSTIVEGPPLAVLVLVVVEGPLLAILVPAAMEGPPLAVLMRVAVEATPLAILVPAALEAPPLAVLVPAAV